VRFAAPANLVEARFQFFGSQRSSREAQNHLKQFPMF
jgi:hypothetical protein